MEISDKIFKRKSGKSKGKWVLRLQYEDPVRGQARTVERNFSSRTGAVTARAALIDSIRKSHGQIVVGERMTFSDLVDICQKQFYKPAVIVDGRKIEGVRSLNGVLSSIASLREFFGDLNVNQITKNHLREYRSWRIDKGSRRAIRSETRTPIKLATVNRELAVMRRMMKFALSEGWTSRDIFLKADVIHASAEVERSRVLTEEEEHRLLDACQGTALLEYERHRNGRKEKIRAERTWENLHLRAMILLALDSGMRRGEILKLDWEDVRFGEGLILVRGTNTKTERGRMVPLTARTEAALRQIRSVTPSVRPFPLTDFKRSWTTVKRIAGVEDLRFHDLRRTAITRWLLGGSPLAIAGKIAGHTQIATTMKHYTAADVDVVRDLAQRLNDQKTPVLDSTV